MIYHEDTFYIYTNRIVIPDMFFRVLTSDNAHNAISVQGSYSGRSDVDISGIIFQNFDNDTKKTYNLSKIASRDVYGNATDDGFGEMVFYVNHTGASNGTLDDLQEAMRITNGGTLAIGGTQATECNEKLTVWGNAVFTSNVTVHDTLSVSNLVITGGATQNQELVFTSSSNIEVDGYIRTTSNLYVDLTSYMNNVYASNVISTSGMYSNVITSNVAFNFLEGDVATISNVSSCNIECVDLSTQTLTSCNVSVNLVATDTLTASNVTTQTLNTSNADIEVLTASNADIEVLTATNADIEVLAASNVSLENTTAQVLTASNADIEVLVASNVSLENTTVQILAASNVSLENTTAQVLTASNADIEVLAASNVTLENTAINLLNATTGFIEGLTSSNGYIDNLGVSNLLFQESNVSANVYINPTSGKLSTVDENSNVSVLNPLTTLGDIFVHNGTTDVRLPIGTDNQILYVNPTSETGLAWKTLSTDSIVVKEKLSSYMFAYNTTSTEISTSNYTDIKYDTVKKRSTNIFDFNGTEVIFKETSTALVSTKLSFYVISGNSKSEVTAYIYYSEDEGVTWTTLPSSILHTTHINQTTGVASATNIYGAVFPQNSRIKVAASVTNGSSTIATIQNACELFIANILIDTNSDISSYLNLISFSNVPIGTTYTDQPFLFEYPTGNAMDLSTPSEVTFSNDGYYIALGKFGYTSQNKSVVETKLQYDNGTGYQDIQGAQINTYIEGDVTSSNSSFLSHIGYYPANTKVKSQARVISGSGVAFDYYSQVIFVFLESSTFGQENILPFNAITQNNQAITGLYTDIVWDTIQTNSGIYSLSNNEIIVKNNGQYYIYGHITYENTNSAANKASSVNTRIIFDIGGGYVENPGTSFYDYMAPLGRETCGFITSQTLPAGAKIRLQTARVTGTGTIILRGLSSSINIMRTEPPVIIDDTLIKYGTFYQYVESPGTTLSTSVNYIEKLRLVTSLIPSGEYNIQISYQIANPQNNKNIIVQVLVDDTNLVHEAQYEQNNSSTFVCNDFIKTSLSFGVHAVSISFSSPSSLTVGLKDAKLCLFRVA